MRRQYGLLRNGGFLGLITTNSVAEGDTRISGLAQIQAAGGFIAFAVRSMRWPGRAVLEVALLSIRKGGEKVDRYLNGRPVGYISSRLDDEPDTNDPLRLKELSGRSYVGSIISGKGFLLERGERDVICERDPRSADVIKTYIGGDDVVRRPDQSASRFVIDFGDLNEEQAATYSECFAIAKERVWPDRKDVKKDVYRTRWWQFAERQARLYESIRHLDRVLVIPQTARWLTVSRVPNQGVFAFGLAVVTTDRLDILAVLQSCWHHEWVKRYSSSLKTDLRYTPSDSFETFPFPGELWHTSNATLAQIGALYHEHRWRLMRELWLGLTDIYNLFHTRNLSPELVAKVSKKPADVARAGFDGLQELRRLHVALDNAVRDAYSWNDLNLGHDFVEVETLPENDRVRFTISAAARKEVLKRLLALNHQRAKEEAARAPAVKPKGAGRKKAAASALGPGLFEEL